MAASDYSHKKWNQRRDPSPIRKWAPRLAILLLFVAIFGWLDTIKDRWYVLDPDHLHELVQAAIASSDDTGGIINHIVANLTATYPSTAIALNPDTSEWTLNNAGGAMGAMYVVHASITEYLLVFGTPLGTEGHTGMHTADDYFYILSGEQWAFKAGALELERYPPGSLNLTPRGIVGQYKMHEGCFALEYARGWIPPMLPFDTLDVFTSTLDFPTLFRTVRIAGREMLRNLLIGKI